MTGGALDLVDLAVELVVLAALILALAVGYRLARALLELLALIEIETRRRR